MGTCIASLTSHFVTCLLISVVYIIALCSSINTTTFFSLCVRCCPVKDLTFQMAPRPGIRISAPYSSVSTSAAACSCTCGVETASATAADASAIASDTGAGIASDTGAKIASILIFLPGAPDDSASASAVTWLCGLFCAALLLPSRGTPPLSWSLTQAPWSGANIGSGWKHA
jgi:hypothetical protein